MTAVSVTAAHIAAGERENCEGCPVVLAIRDAYPGLAYVAAGPEEITIQPGLQEPEIRLDVSREVQEFIWDFDDGGEPGPFTFELDYPAVTP